MELKQLLAEDDAVSPVIGVILMVAITVILAAVIGTFVLGIGQDQQTTPSATFDFNWDNSSQNLTITHSGGDTFTTENSNNLEVISSGGTYDSEWQGGFAGNAPVSAGNSYTVNGDARGETVRIVWTAPGGGKTNTVGSFDVPS